LRFLKQEAAGLLQVAVPPAAAVNKTGGAMLKNITDSLQQVSSEPIALLFSLLLGLVSAATSVCCTLPALGILVGYSGSRKSTNRIEAIKSSLYFTVGIIISLMIVGLIAGFIGQTAQSALGRYWKLFAGIVAVLFGLASLNLFPVKISFGNLGKTQLTGKIGIAFTGLILGGIIAVSSLPCNPGIFIVIGTAILQGKVVWSILLLAMFAVGFSIPLGAILMGVSLGSVSLKFKGLDRVIRYIAGVVLVIAGFYFLVTY
jgi:cytochrome c biogenesis protein CcdA